MSPLRLIIIIVAVSLVVFVLLFFFGKESPKDTATIRVLKQFAVLELVLVVLPWAVITLSLIFMPMLGIYFGKAYHFLPFVIFGKSDFMHLADMLQAAGVYSVIALLLSFLRLLPSKSPSTKCARCGSPISLEAAACEYCGHQFAPLDR
jgi:hypothetical protein